MEQNDFIRALYEDSVENHFSGSNFKQSVYDSFDSLKSIAMQLSTVENCSIK